MRLYRVPGAMVLDSGLEGALRLESRGVRMAATLRGLTLETP
jgi:hypothetical protein